MDKIKTVKIKNPDGSVSEESYTISVDAKNVDMKNGKDLQDTIGDINVDRNGSIAEQLGKYKDYDSDIETLYADVDSLEAKDTDLENDIINLQVNKINKTDIIDNLNSSSNTKVLSAKQGKVLGDAVTALEAENVKKKPYYFNTVADMKADLKLKAGDMAVTLGYYEVNDGGAAEYQIISGNYTDDGGSYLRLKNNLFAKLIIKENTVSIKQFGAYGDNSHNDVTAFNNIINYISGKYMTLYLNKGVYKLMDSININWANPNFNSNFGGSYEIKGAGIFETKLHFTSSNGLLINPNSNALTIKIHDFCIENKDYNILTETGNERTPDVSKGIGLLVRHIGYMGKVYSIAVKGFYIGIMSKNCYGGPIFENLFVNWCVFGYYSKDDTTIVHNSCSYLGIESCYLQDGSQSTLTNVICEGNQKWFKDDNTYNQRSKFEGRGFSFINNAYVNAFNCYVEDTYGNCVYINNSFVKDINNAYSNFMNYHLTLPEYSDLKNWLDNNPGHNYDDIYVYLKNETQQYISFESGSMVGTGTVYVDVQNNDNSYVEYTPMVRFIGLKKQGSITKNYSRFYKGHTKPVIIDTPSYYGNNSNFDNLPMNLYGVPNFVNDKNPTNAQGYNSMQVRRKGNFGNSNYNEVNLSISHNLNGKIQIYKQTLLDGVSVDNLEVMTINEDGTVVFPQNSN